MQQEISQFSDAGIARWVGNDCKRTCFLFRATGKSCSGQDRRVAGVLRSPVNGALAQNNPILESIQFGT